MTDSIITVKRLRNILIQPLKEWEVINLENHTVKQVRSSFLLPLLVLIAISAIAGSFIYNPRGLSFLYPLVPAVKHFLALYLTIVLSSWAMNEISLAIVPVKDYTFIYKLITYSLSPFFITLFITRLIPELDLINIFGIYGGYIMFCGLRVYEKISGQALIRYFIVALFTVIVFYFGISWIINSLIEGVYFALTGSL